MDFFTWNDTRREGKSRFHLRFQFSFEILFTEALSFDRKNDLRLGISIKSKDSHLKVKFPHEIVVLRRSPNEKFVLQRVPNPIERSIESEIAVDSGA
ncbi:hypothetical protein LEP1GSC175_2063 [Leptospira santarosai str. HAI821]|nr:hypothetical protein LEP1GSC175_2063 [Leptospira santarosai str. HAI821]